MTSCKNNFLGFFFFKIVFMTQRESALEQAGVGVEGDG